MRINSVSTKQFAGLRDVGPVKFDPSLTVLYGKNETGKSTLINLIYCLLRRDCKVRRGGKAEEDFSDKDFRNRFMPSQDRERTVYGSLEFEDEAGLHHLEKSWDEDGSVSYKAPDKEVYGKKDYEEPLNRALKLPASIYSEILFANQKSIEKVIERLLDGKMDSGKDLSTVATTMLLDLNGVPSEAFLAEVSRRMTELGKSWNVEGDRPEKPERIKNKIGDILKAYYDYQDAVDKLEKLNALYGNLADAEHAYKLADKAYGDAKANRKSFEKNALLSDEKIFDMKRSAKSLLQDLFARMYEAEVQEWQEGSDVRALFWKKCAQDLEAGQMSLEEAEDWLKGPENGFSAVRNLQAEIDDLEKKIQNFRAFIRLSMTDGYDVRVYSELDGRALEITEDGLNVNEAVRIEIPGVGEIHLAGADIDATGIHREICQRQDSINAILKRYSVSDLEGMDRLKKRIEAVQAKQISDSKEQMLSDLLKEEQKCFEERDDARGKFNKAEEAVENEEKKDGFMSVDELEEEIEDLRAELQKRKEEYRAWEHIKATAEQILDEARKQPLDRLEASFRKNLRFLTDGRVTAEKMNPDLSSTLYSGDNPLTYKLLSEGTKDSIALAFRLAAVDLIYPDGGAVVAFDDPFTDMDEDRRMRACELLNQFAERNQVIFATCDTRYFDLLNGKKVSL